MSMEQHATMEAKQRETEVKWSGSYFEMVGE
jgi:hypothetical protein